MDPSRIIKTVAIFVAGVVISVGSALIYSIREQRQLDERTRMIAQTHPTRLAKFPTMVIDSNESGDPEVPQSKADSTITPRPEPALKPSSRAPQGTTVQPSGVGQPNGSDEPAKPKTRLPDTANGKPQAKSAVPTVLARSAALPPQPDSQTEPSQVSPESPTSVPQLAEQGSAPATPVQPRVVTLQPGTNLTIRLAEALSNSGNHAGDMFHGTLESPLMVDGIVVAGKGAAVLGRVVAARQSHLMHGTPELALTLTQISAMNGRPVPVQTNEWQQVGAHTGLVGKAKRLAGTAVGSVAGAVSGAAKVVGVNSAVANEPETSRAKRGQVIVPATTELTFRLAMPVTISEKAR
jgi:hypothetical protein